ncbi:hypothetical protein D3C80_1833970 [compost metagenome]
MGLGGRPEKHRAGFAGSLVTHRNDEIRRQVLVDIAGFAVEPCRRDFSLIQRFQTQRMHFTFRLTAGAVGVHIRRSQVIEHGFTKNAAAAVSSAEKQNLHQAIS